MRDIKFRVWDNKDNCWTSPARLNEYDSKCFIYEFFGSCYQRDNYIISQYTGLNDNNNKEIYEGDIVHYLFDGNSYPKEAVDKNLICVYDTSNAWFVFREHIDDSDDGYYWLEVKNNIEVVGNIYENRSI
jgi:uncharacterized phage protein (TIGR01671 family)